MNVSGTFYALLLSNSAGRGGTAAVSVAQTLNTLLFGQGAGRVGGGAVIVGFTGDWERASVINANISAKLNSSPVVKGAVAVVTAFYAATLVEVAIRSTVIFAVVIGSTIVDADTSNGVAVRLVGLFTSIGGVTSGRSASVATSISSAVSG